MKAVSRRDLLALSSAMRQGSAPAEAGQEATLSRSAVFSLDQMPVATKPNGARSWDILHGVLATGETIAVHASMQPAGIAPSPAHAIQHSEFILVQEGTLVFEHDGQAEKVGPGGVVFVAFGTMHAARNVGEGPAKYLVVAIGGDTK